VLTIRATVCGSPHQEQSKTRSPAFGQPLCSMKTSDTRIPEFPHSKLASVLFLLELCYSPTIDAESLMNTDFKVEPQETLKSLTGG
jgi:hypothetical protein